MLEIYNEEYKDLLGKALPAGKKHQVKHRVCLSSAVLTLCHLLHLVSHACVDPSTVSTASAHGFEVELPAQATGPFLLYFLFFSFTTCDETTARHDTDAATSRLTKPSLVVRCLTTTKE